MGLDSMRERRTSYDLESHEVNVEGRFKATEWLNLSALVGLMGPDVSVGPDDRYPSLEQLFTDSDAPGLANQPRYLRTTLSADVDCLDEDGNPRRGGSYHVAFGIWNDTSLKQYNFRRFDLLLRQFMPLGSERAHVVSGRFGVSYVNNSTGDRVPFYFLPYVGGVDTVRSFHEFRFKDENAVWMSGEYRWILDPSTSASQRSSMRAKSDETTRTCTAASSRKATALACACTRAGKPSRASISQPAAAKAGRCSLSWAPGSSVHSDLR